MLKPVDQSFRDGENNRVRLDAAYRISESGLSNTISEIYRKHGRDTCLLPLSAVSAAGGVYQQKTPSGEPIIGILVGATANPKIRHGSIINLESVSLDEIVIDHENMEVCAGAAITIDQLNHALADTISPAYRVPGSDLTSYSYAQVGSTFMTGGMGPQRRYFSDSATQILLHNGYQLETIDREELVRYAGTYGWTGLVSAVRLRYCKLPENEIAFALPIHNDSREISRLLEHLTQFCFFEFGQGLTVNLTGEPDVIIGLEHVTSGSMEPLIQNFSSNAHANRARQLSQKCREMNADGVLFVNGCTNHPVDEFLNLLIDDSDGESICIGGIDLESAEIFRSANEMRELREAIPYAARMREPHGEYRHKNHTDANIRLNPEQTALCAENLWNINKRYVNEIEQFIEETDGLRGDIIVYGHMNPYGLDPHNRLTIVADSIDIINTARESVNQFRSDFYRRLGDMCEQTASELIGGEKGAVSEHEIIEALGGLQSTPLILGNKYLRQVDAVSSASHNFNWRAFHLYGN
ncbi:MAG: FAD-dependent oxidoreductase [Gammaproteobacteria bacterium]|nr:FAD-dependent oxidoreductase [Gammaproteobacteria bacterium]